MEPWHYERAVDLDSTLADRLRRFPREPDITVYTLRTMAALLTRGWLRAYHRLEIHGREHLPAQGSFVVAANHASHLDTLCLLAALPLRKLHRAFPVAAQDYFFDGVPRTAAAAILVNALPFARQTHIGHSLDLCHRLLANPGNILILFPEGTRSTTGQMGDFRPGLGMLVAGLDVPVLPCYLEGTFAAWPKGKSIPRPAKVRLRIGPSQTFAGLPRRKDTAEKIAGAIRQSVLALANRTAADEFVRVR
jgi:1-acyl-sn-glycerol-3-phosphate acyltransferase